MVRNVSNSSCGRTIINENTYWTIIIFNFETVITFSYYECYLSRLGFFNCLSKVRWNSFFIMLECFVHSKKQCCSYINKPTTQRCCRKEVFHQIGLRNSWQQQNPWKVSFNELRFNENVVLYKLNTFIKSKLRVNWWKKN